jgi:hypothetical protein
MADDPQPVVMVGTCRTSGCPFEGVPVTAPYIPNADPPTYRGWCDPCQQPVTDIVPAA